MQFQSDLFGYRAAFRVLRSYFKLHGLCNLQQIIRRWAPPEDGNDTNSYVETVAERSGVRPLEHLAFEDEDKLIAIVSAMAWVESNIRDPNPDLLRHAYSLVR